ncbi:sodium- and chloride-dependent GABA transporter 3-like isoform X1 [Lates japonicus]|uniref:Transporter n=1 Tax=Lates japonicus TaxID=270547 RepID=A0AAD3M9C5_LATJO|nr:sodium- and chloride-dependent GABA transporter 3-like isoform X1 [Lates japonicus]
MNRERRKAVNQRRAGDRGQWASKTEYVLVVAGNVVGLGNVWRFPYLCYKNGGGAFLVPYCLLAVVCGIPLFLLETSVGQYTQEGFITCWRKLCPLAQGIGYGHFVIKLYDFIYIIIQVWALFYLASSFTSKLPWASCDNSWNTVNCVGLQSLSNETVNHTMLTNTTSAATEFWERRVLVMSGGIEELGSVRWELALCLLVCWVFCYFSIWKSVRSSGKVAYFTATFPCAMLLILLIRGLTLPGAWEGIYFYLYPDLNRLANLEVWIEAGSQICFSYSVAAGTLIVLGSYNEYNNNCFNGTSFVAGFVVFSVLGFMAQKQGITVDTVAESGPGLAFIAYPQATAMMPLPQFWTVCFFLMLIFLSVDTHSMNFIGADRVIDVIEDMTGQRPCAFFKLCWKYIIPLLSLISLVLYLVGYTHLKLNNQYVYPAWAYGLGWTITLSSVLMVPLWAAGQMCWTAGTFRERLHILCRPAEDPARQRRKTGEEEEEEEEEGATVELRTSEMTA